MTDAVGTAGVGPIDAGQVDGGPADGGPVDDGLVGSPVDGRPIDDDVTAPIERTEPVPATELADPVPAGARRPGTAVRLWSGALLTVVVAFAVVVAVRLHRNGHGTGDDFALYLNQARALTEGNIAEVITQNRFLWQNSVGVTPQIYPWGFPILLAPFVRVFGIDAYNKLKLVEVACLAVWLVLFHGIVRRRAGRIIAIALTAVFATSYSYLVHTDQLLTELPHLVATGVFLWWLDRCMAKGRLLDATRADLVALGLLAVAAYNVRRESLVLLAVIAAAQCIDAAGIARQFGRVVADWRRVVTPYLTFAVAAALFQFLLPSTLIPDNGNSFGNILQRWWTADRTAFPRQFATQLGLGSNVALGKVLLVLAVVGAVITCWRRPRLHVPLVVFVLATMILVGTHPRMVARYYLQVTPFLAYFAAMVPVSLVELALRGRRLSPLSRRSLLVVLMAPALWTTAVHVWTLPARVDAAATFNDAGRVQPGGATPRNQAAYDAIIAHTEPDAIVTYYRVRTMTLYTGRRGVQTSLISKAERLSDYFMQSLWNNDYSQPRISAAELESLGWTVVWENSDWRLWRAPQPDVDVESDTVD